MKRRTFLPAVALSLAAVAGCGAGSENSAPTAAPVGPLPATPETAPSADAPSFERKPRVPVVVPAETQAIVDSPERDAADKALRRPGELLAFFELRPGMKVAELGAGGGYTAELLARAVGASGAVYGVNNEFVLQKFAEKPWSERLKKPALKNVVRLDREFDDPFPAELGGLDAVFCVLVYHDFFWLGFDRKKTNAAVFRVLKPGGVYAIIDHSGRPGSAATEVQTLHRIEQKTLVDDVEQAGFRLTGEGDFLRNPDDARDWNDSPGAAGQRRGASDRFVLKFVKP